MKQLLPKLTARLQQYAYRGARQPEVPKFMNIVPKEDNQIISQAWFWPRMGKFFKEKDIIVAETGTLTFLDRRRAKR